MRILVCVKRVPAPGARINVTADGLAVGGLRRLASGAMISTTTNDRTVSSSNASAAV